MSDNLPEPIIEKILLSLPTKHLIKCTAVCKSWLSLIKSSTFIQTHLNRSIQVNNSRLFLLHERIYLEASGNSYSLLCPDSVFSDRKQLMNPITYNGGTIVYKGRDVSPQSLVVIGTCNGLVCLAPQPCVDSPAMIWNPSIRSLVILPNPPPSRHYERYAFGYDSRTNDYKVLILTTVCDYLSKIVIRGDIYSLASGTWKNLSADTTHIAMPPPVYNALALVNINGSPHWSGDDGDYEGANYICVNKDNSIMSFDMVSEVFCKIKVPEALGEQPTRCIKYGDCLAVATEKVSLDFDIWVMKEYGVAESWTKITLRHEGDLIMRELVYCRGEELVFGKYGPNMYVVDCRSGQEREFITGTIGYYFFDSFVESILLLGHADAISY